MTAAGRLRHRIELQERSEEQSDSGEVVEKYLTAATVWGEVLDAGAREVFRAQQTDPEVTAIVRIRWRSGVRPEMRATARLARGGTRTFDVRGVRDPDGRGVELLLDCLERV